MFSNVRSERQANWDPPVGDPFHSHRFNQAKVEERREKSVEETFAGAEVLRKQLKDVHSRMGRRTSTS